MSRVFAKPASEFWSCQDSAAGEESRQRARLSQAAEQQGNAVCIHRQGSEDAINCISFLP